MGLLEGSKGDRLTQVANTEFVWPYYTYHVIHERARKGRNTDWEK